MENTYQQDFKAGILVLATAKADILAIMSNPEYSAATLVIVGGLDGLISKLQHFGGIVPDKKAKAQDAYPPITNFLGDKIDTAPGVTYEDITPAAADVDLFVNKVNSLLASFNDLSPDQILTSYTTPEDQLAIRGVAKHAGLSDYETAKLDKPYLEKIALAIREMDLTAEERALYEDKLLQQEENTFKPGSSTSKAAPARDVEDNGLSQTTTTSQAPGAAEITRQEGEGSAPDPTPDSQPGQAIQEPSEPAASNVAQVTAEMQENINKVETASADQANAIIEQQQPGPDANQAQTIQAPGDSKKPAAKAAAKAKGDSKE